MTYYTLPKKQSLEGRTLHDILHEGLMRRTACFQHLWTFGLIVTAHPYCARKLECHVIHPARALSTKMNNDKGRWPLLWLCLDFTILDIR